MDEDDSEIELNPENKLWHPIKHCKVYENQRKEGENRASLQKVTYQGYKLMPNDIIKLGRVRFKVREIVSPAYIKKQGKAMKKLRIIKGKDHFMNQSSRDIGEPIRFGEEAISIVHNEEGNQKEKSVHIIRNASEKSVGGSQTICRICLSEEDEDALNNPLFSPCKCAGTMKYIHLNCLQDWLNSRMITKETPSTKTYFWKNLECELCKTAFPNYVKPPGENTE
jgi:hypothetical protein